MFEFIIALGEFEFLQNALLAGFLASIGCGLMGPFVVINRISYLAGGIAHAVLGGVGAAIYFGFPVLLSALITAILSALLIAYIKLKLKQHEDTVIGAIWAMGMAIGVIFISLTPGYNNELLSYLFGNILMVSQTEINLMLYLDLAVLSLVFIFYRHFIMISFDSEYAQTRGIQVNLFYTLMLCLVALIVVLLIQVVGLILVIALLTLPAAIAGQYFNHVYKIILMAIGLGFIFSFSGLFISYQNDIPSGASIIMIATSVFLLSTFFARKILNKLVK